MMHNADKPRSSLRWESEINAERLARYCSTPKRYGHLVCHSGRMVDGFPMYPLPFYTRLILWIRRWTPKSRQSKTYPHRIPG